MATTIKSKKPIIQLAGIVKNYKTKAGAVPALNDVSLTINQGEVVAIMGPSGSGKSTLMHMIAGLDRPSSGTVTVQGRTLNSLKDNEMAEYRNHTIGFVFQFFYLQPFLTVLQNTEIPLIFAGTDKAARKAKAKEMLAEVGLTDKMPMLPNQLSGGQMQRVAIARALVSRPAIILADEPTGNLDRQTGKEVIDLLLKARQDFGTTIVIVTHDSAVARRADRIIKISDGRIK